MMFQSYALFPHLTVEKNIAFGLVQDRMPKAEIATHVKDAVDKLHLARSPPSSWVSSRQAFWRQVPCPGVRPINDDHVDAKSVRMSGT